MKLLSKIIFLKSGLRQIIFNYLSLKNQAEQVSIILRFECDCVITWGALHQFSHRIHIDTQSQIFVAAKCLEPFSAQSDLDQRHVTRVHWLEWKALNWKCNKLLQNDSSIY